MANSNRRDRPSGRPARPPAAGGQPDDLVVPDIEHTSEAGQVVTPSEIGDAPKEPSQDAQPGEVAVESVEAAAEEVQAGVVEQTAEVAELAEDSEPVEAATTEEVTAEAETESANDAEEVAVEEGPQTEEFTEPAEPTEDIAESAEQTEELTEPAEDVAESAEDVAESAEQPVEPAVESVAGLVASPINGATEGAGFEDLADEILSLDDRKFRDQDLVVGTPKRRGRRGKAAEQPQNVTVNSVETSTQTEEVEVTNDKAANDAAADDEAKDVVAEDTVAADPEPEPEVDAKADEPVDAKPVRAGKPTKKAVKADEIEKTSEKQGGASPMKQAHRELTQAPVKKDKPTRRRDENVQVTTGRTTPFMFVRQSIAELRKVVWPSGDQVGQYFVVVLVFVLFLMLVVAGLDYLFGLGLMKIFG